MSIVFNPKLNLFSLESGGCSYAMMVHPVFKRLFHLYYGPRVNADELACISISDGIRGLTTVPAGIEWEEGSLDVYPQEFSSSGCGDFRCCSARVRTADGFNAVDAVYVSHRIYPGKPELSGLPASFAPESEVETLEITLADPTTGIEYQLFYSIFAGLPLVVRSTRAINRSNAPVYVEKLASLTLDLPNDPLDVVAFPGAWVREREFSRSRLERGIRNLSSLRGLSSPQMNPFFILCDPETDEVGGRAWGQMLVYSGCFAAEIERGQFDSVRVQFGINPENFRWKLEPGESFQTPEAVTAFSSSGFGELSRIFHDFMRENIIRAPWNRRSRPVVINNWEATRFSFTEEKIIDFARVAAEVGLDMLVLDDGWFGKRDDAKSSLGDWFVHSAKLPHGLPALVEKINALGLKFGLWFEPEMVSPDSELFRAHPDWCIHIPGRPSSLGRYQLVLDMGRPEVVDYLFRSMTAILDSANIEYLKWDANRHITEAGSAALPPDRQGETLHRFVLGTYDLLARLRRRYPNLLMEGCSSGGGRFDAGMLYYTPQIWTSDDTDAVERLFIQYGTSFGYPCSAMTAHVSAVPNHQVGRTTPLRTRGDVALAGVFGYELDPTVLSDEERNEVRRQIAACRAAEKLTLEGDYLRLSSPYSGGLVAWQSVAKDKSEFVFTVARILCRPNQPPYRVRLRGIDPDAVYTDENGESFSGAFLMNVGYPISRELGDFQSVRRHFKKR